MQLGTLAALSPAWPAFFLAVAAVMGAVMGSFINCMAWRIVHGESVWKGRSHCATCDHQLSALDLIPLISWLVLRGKCRYCGQRISPRYPLVELLLAAYFASIVAAYGLTVHALSLCVLGCILMGLSLVDLDTFTIPNGFIVAAILTWLATFAFYGVDLGSIGLGTLTLGLAGSPVLAVLVDGLVGAFAVAGAMLALSFAFDKVVGRQSLGGGDVKLLFTVGLFLGVAGSVLNLIAACIVGIAFSFATQRARARADDPRVFPFGPSIALATWFTLVLGPPLLGWYFGLF
ncbi:prepilin peptidase [Arabiibacter massiliensis]|uniref:prepilin peptidase n=1 Tax=Arabiibacter massiliensis TaxID=1870985 RepID=UPI0009BB44CA|nr:A24 family peptidase [Arabiibacter massiliensis]